MLTRRTNILFDESLWNKLSQVAKTERVSVGKLVRTALTEKYLENDDLSRIQKAHDTILKIRKITKGKIDYKALINEGRRF